MPVTAQGTTVVVLRKRDLSGAGERWNDPNGITASAESRRGILLSNPSLRDDDPVQLVGLQGNRVIGSSCVISGRMVVESQEHPFLWCSNLFVDPAARRTMIALKIVKALQELSPTVAVCGTSHAAYALYKAFGWIDFAMPRYILLRRSRPVLERRIGEGMLSRCLRIPVDSGLRMFNHRLLRPRSRLEWNVSRAVPQELAERLDGRPDEKPNTFLKRGAETVQWQLNGGIPGTPGDCNFLVTIYAAGTLAGYAAAKVKFFPVASAQGYRNLRLGSLYDWCILDREKLSFRDLVACASRELVERGADAVELCATDTQEEAILRSMWLPRMGENHLMWRTEKGGTLDHERYRNRERWHIRPGDDDLFI